jgi:hypothetical protein
MMGASEEQADELMVSPEAIVGQAALESAWGKAAIGRNVFGIKAGPDWKGPTLMQRTAEQRADGSVYFIVAAFRDYPTLKACVDDHFAILKENPAYRAAGVFDAHNDRGYFEALQRGGYATDVAYADKLMGMVASVRLFTASMVVSDTAPAIAQAAPAPRLLLIGMTGGDVGLLQGVLAANHVYRGPIDDDFGPATRAAVITFQRAHRLAADGMVGAETRKALGL